MFSSIIGWVKGLSVVGKVALGVAALGTAGVVNGVVQPAATQPLPTTQQPTAEVKEATITTETVVETQALPYGKRTQEDSNLKKGSSQISTPGVDGVKTLTFKITKVDGKQTNKELIKEETTTPPVDEITSVGTYVEPQAPPRAAPRCDPNYAGACVPVASDVDCGSGSGNGPAYVYGVVTVIGSDIYGLDRDGDGLGCE